MEIAERKTSSLLHPSSKVERLARVKEFIKSFNVIPEPETAHSNDNSGHKSTIEESGILPNEWLKGDYEPLPTKK